MTDTDDLTTRLDDPGTTTIDCSAYPRLPATFVLQASRRRQPPTLTNVSADAAQILDLLGLAQRFGITAPRTISARDLPFQLSIEADATLVVAADRGIAQHRMLDEPLSHGWARGLIAPKLVVDMAAVEQVNSVLVAWLLQLAQAAKPAATTVLRARPQIVTQFKQLRLDQMMTLG